jgi:hypothetical protein
VVKAYGAVGSDPTAAKWTVAKLLEWAEANDSTRAGKGGGNGKNASAETKDVQSKVKKACIDALNVLTVQDISDLESWKKFWDEKGKDFKFPDPNAPAGAAVAAATIDPAAPEFKDGTYDFVVKRPEAEGWKFSKPDYTADETPRVMLQFHDAENGMEMARAYFIIHPIKTVPHDVKGMAEWALANPFKTQLETDAKHAPETTTKKTGEYEWTIVGGKGNGLALRAGFGSQERRFYFVKLDNNILYIDACIRLGADEAVAKAFWAAIDGVILPSATPAKK